VIAVPPSLVHDVEEWNRRLLALPGAHLLQSWQWGELKSHYGWQAARWLWTGDAGKPAAAAQVLRRQLTGLKGISVLYVPRGPCLDYADASLRQEVFRDLQDMARRGGAIFLKIDPAVEIGRGLPGSPEPAEEPSAATLTSHLHTAGWRFSPEQIQFRNTLTLDLRQGDDALLATMKPKTRYNIRLAERHGVRVREGRLEDLDLLYRMYAETSLRDGFVIRHEGYYQEAWGSFMRAGLAQPLIAELEGAPVAGLIVYRFGPTCWYLYGMSREAHREAMPNHILQWEAIRWARAHGCTVYDFWGAPDRLGPDDPMWGVYRFKEGFGAELIRTLGAWDYPARPTLYAVYTRLLPRLLELLRARGRRQTARSLE
jgi:lipid II:glycine glycyltransferase (peptidoglycan interpeptide bridge formation enzyme)